MWFWKKKQPKDEEVARSFQNSFQNDNAIDMAVDVADLTIDKFVDSDVVNGVPVVGLLNASYKIYKNIQAYRLAKKVYLFLYHTNEIAVEKKRAFVEEYIESNQEDGIDALLAVIDQLDNQNKVTIMARLLKAKIDGSITISEFNRLVTCLQRIPYSDIVKLKDFVDDYYEPGLAEILNTAGVLYLSQEDYETNSNKYKLNYNGVLLLKYGLGINICIPSEYKIKRISFVKAEDIDEKIKASQPRIEGETLVFP